MHAEDADPDPSSVWISGSKSALCVLLRLSVASVAKRSP